MKKFVSCKYQREDNAHSALQSILKVALSTSSGQNLRLQHQILCVQVGGDLLGLLTGLCHAESAIEWKALIKCVSSAESLIQSLAAESGCWLH